MSARPLWRPVVVREEDREATMRQCPSEDVLILYGSTRPETDPDDGELLEGWTAEAVARHLTLCPACRSSVEASRALTGALREDVAREPPEAFWDEMADQVMNRLDAEPSASPQRTEASPRRARRPGEDAAVIPLRRPGQLGIEPATAHERSPATWLWAAAAGLALLLSVAAYLSQDDPVLDGVEGGERMLPTPVADALPDAAAAAAAASALGLSLDPIDTGAVAEVDALELGGAAGDTGVSSLADDLRSADADDLELTLGYDDAISELFELDTEAMESILAALESKT